MSEAFVGCWRDRVSIAVAPSSVYPRAVSRYAPVAPFERWPRQVCFAGGYAWLVPAAQTDLAIVTQTYVAEATAQTAHAVADFLDQVVLGGELAGAGQVWVLHDWRSLSTVANGARAAWTTRTRRPGNPFAQSEIYVALGASPILRMTLRAAALTIQLAQGQRAARFVDDLRPILRQAGVREPNTADRA